MKTSETEIRRLANGSIDTAWYVRHCHRRRSLAAHKAIAQIFTAVTRALTGKRNTASPAAVAVGTAAQPIEISVGTETERMAA